MVSFIGVSPHTVNAFYQSQLNKFVLLAAILKEPFFSPDADDAALFGGIGYVVGHEIGHGFDDQGSHYDAKGNLQNWWTKEDTSAFVQIKRSLMTQANRYELHPGVYLKGELELGEIIGDMNGIEIAYRALMRKVEETGQDSEQAREQFFQQVSKAWRRKTRPEFEMQLLETDNHPPGEFRVNGILKNLDAFHEHYETEPGDGMYLAPEERQHMW